jgi:hypothetical protein
VRMEVPGRRQETVESSTVPVHLHMKRQTETIYFSQHSWVLLTPAGCKESPSERAGSPKEGSSSTSNHCPRGYREGQGASGHSSPAPSTSGDRAYVHLEILRHRGSAAQEQIAGASERCASFAQSRIQFSLCL